MRKKIPTIVRPDDAYTASLRQSTAEIPGRDDEGQGQGTSSVTTPDTSMTEAEVHPSEKDVIEAREQCGGGSAAALAPTELAPITKTTYTTRKVDIRVNALQRQEAALLASGVDPAHVVRAALRRVAKSWDLVPKYVPPSSETRTRDKSWQARTSLAVDAAHLRTLQADHDPLDVCSKWAMIRGQIEPRIWAEIDTVLTEIARNAAMQRSVDGA